MKSLLAVISALGAVQAAVVKKLEKVTNEVTLVGAIHEGVEIRKGLYEGSLGIDFVVAGETTEGEHRIPFFIPVNAIGRKVSQLIQENPELQGESNGKGLIITIKGSLEDSRWAQGRKLRVKAHTLEIMKESDFELLTDARNGVRTAGGTNRIEISGLIKGTSQAITQSGTEVQNFDVEFGNNSLIRAIAWGSNPTVQQNNFVEVEGSLKSVNWEKDGVKKTGVNITVSNLEVTDLATVLAPPAAPVAQPKPKRQYNRKTATPQLAAAGD